MVGLQENYIFFFSLAAFFFVGLGELRRSGCGCGGEDGRGGT